MMWLDSNFFLLLGESAKTKKLLNVNKKNKIEPSFQRFDGNNLEENGMPRNFSRTIFLILKIICFQFIY